MMNYSDEPAHYGVKKKEKMEDREQSGCRTFSLMKIPFLFWQTIANGEVGVILVRKQN